MLHQVLCHECCFRCLVVTQPYLDFLAVFRVGPQLLSLALTVIAYDRIGAVQDVSRGSVVLLKPYYLGRRKIFLEPEYVLYVRASETVYRLVVITDSKYIVVIIGEQLYQPVLSVAGICTLPPSSYNP